MGSDNPFCGGGVLSSREVRERNLVKGAKIEQFQTNSVDLTVGKIFYPLDLPFGAKPTDMDYEKMPLILEDEDVDPYWIIPKGQPVLIEIAEIINLSGDVTRTTQETDYLGPVFGYAVGRSSLHRIGVLSYGSWWDWKYSGRGKLLVIPMAADLLIKKGDRFASIAFFSANLSDNDYKGTYQGEGLKV